MGTAREARKSELIFGRVWNEMRNLSNCVWHPLLKDAEEHVDSIKHNLDLTIEEMKHEDSEKIPSNKGSQPNPA